MTIYIINGHKEVVETISIANPVNAAAIGTRAVAELKDDRAYWTDRPPKSYQVSPAAVEHATYRDEDGYLVHQVGSRSREVIIDGWMV
jgi:hypothetical protein